MKTTTIQSYSGDIYERQETEYNVSFRRIAKKKDPDWEPLARVISTQGTIDQLRADLAAERKRREEAEKAKPKEFPLLGTGRRIPWSIAEQAYEKYSKRYGTDQSLERLAQRGGFDARELDEFVPDWRQQVSEITTLREDLSTAREALRVMGEALKDLYNYADGLTCRHESTHRGGALWEICEDCGQKWADDEGGKPQWEEPRVMAIAEEALSHPFVVKAMEEVEG